VARGVLADGEVSASHALPRLAASVLLGVWLGGCSILNVFEPARKASLVGDDDLTTASIPSRARTSSDQVSPLSPELDAEDWRRAGAAMATALDPQGNGGLVKWENPASGARGSFSAAGDAYLIGDEICRNFAARLSGAEGGSAHQGSACRAAPGDWRIREHRAVKQPG
jgi:hypothetical protein